MDPKKKNEDTDYDINENYHEEMLKASMVPAQVLDGGDGGERW